MFPSFLGTGCGWTWEEFFNRIRKIFYLLLILHSAGVDFVSVLFLAVMQLLCTQFHPEAYKGVIEVTVSTLVGVCEHDTGEAGLPGKGQVELVLAVEERVADAQAMVAAQLQQALPVLIFLVPN